MNKILPVLVIGILLAASCKKSGSGNTNLVASTVFLGLPIGFSYTFDSKGRISVVTDTLGGSAVDAINTYIYN